MTSSNEVSITKITAPANDQQRVLPGARFRIAEISSLPRFRKAAVQLAESH